ncbi:MAG TPA: ScyD/ScyE family protein [Edaphobacter sp.]|nr:ScyD/ScyE family protein [Edaphobacter sp.]
MNFRLAASLCLAVSAASIASAPAYAQLSSNATVFASGLESPRGLKFGPDGDLYVAEAGTGGTISTVGSCAQVPPPIGSYLGGNTGRISKLDRSGNRTTVATGFPSALAAEGDLQGVADIAFLNGTLYAVTAGGGCSHGNASSPNIIARVNTKSGSWTAIANLSQFVQSHPAAYPDAGDFEPDGVFYSLIAYDNRLYTVEPNHGQLFSASAGGDLREELDISKQEGHIVPTSIAVNDGKFYIGNLGLFPITPDSSKIMSFNTGGCPWPFLSGFGCGDEIQKLRLSGSRAGFTTVVAVDFGPDGLLYALELNDAAGFPTPPFGVGKVVRLNRAGVIEDVATGLSLATGMTFGPDGYLYVSNFGAAPSGQILRISVR